MTSSFHYPSRGLATWRAATALAFAVNGALAGLLIPSTSQAAQPLEYRVILLGGATAGASSVATGINELGQVVGYTEKREWSGLQRHAVLWNNSVMTVLDTDKSSMAYDINNHGQVVGTSANRPTLWQSGNKVLLAAPNGYSIAHAINDAGQIVGGSYVESKAALLWEDGVHTSYTTLPGLGGTTSWAEGINEAGQIVGTSETAEGRWHAVLWDNGSVTDLAPDSNHSEAYAINENGQVVGTAEFGWHAMLWSNGSGLVLHEAYATWGFGINNQGIIVGGEMDYDTFADRGALMWSDDGTMTEVNTLVDPAQAFLLRALDINERGWIVGSALNPQTNIAQAFVLIPVPEPSSYVLLFSGAAVLLAVGRRGRRV